MFVPRAVRPHLAGLGILSKVLAVTGSLRCDTAAKISDATDLPIARPVTPAGPRTSTPGRERNRRNFLLRHFYHLLKKGPRESNEEVLARRRGGGQLRSVNIGLGAGEERGPIAVSCS